MKHQKSLIIGGVVVLLLIAVGYFVSQSADKTPENGTLDGSVQTLTQTQRESIVTTYLKAKINEVSPDSAVLGGTFHVTDVKFTGPDQGEVMYEDGHIALTADFSYTINEAILSEGAAAVEVVLTNVRD